MSLAQWFPILETSRAARDTQWFPACRTARPRNSASAAEQTASAGGRCLEPLCARQPTSTGKVGRRRTLFIICSLEHRVILREHRHPSSLCEPIPKPAPQKPWLFSVQRLVCSEDVQCCDKLKSSCCSTKPLFRLEAVAVTRRLRRSTALKPHGHARTTPPELRGAPRASVL